MALSDWSAIILAAGESRRFGAPKMLADFGGLPVIRRTTEAVIRAHCSETILVTGNESDAIARALLGLDCRIVCASDWADGMSASLRSGVAARQSADSGVFVFLGDMPLVPVHLCEQLAGLALTSGFAARPVVGGVPGHPVCFAPEAIDALQELSGDHGAAHVLQARRSEVAYLETDDLGAVCDCDTPEELARTEALWNARFTSATIDSAISTGDLPNP